MHLKITTAMTNSKLLGHASAAGAYIIFGFNIVVCKDLTTEQYVSPFGIFLLRSIGAGLIFWLLSLFTKREKVSRGDLWRIFLASLFGFFLTQITFLMAIPLITPMESAITGALTPVFTMLIAAVAVHEPITGKKAGGVTLSLAGVLYLIISSMSGNVPGGSSNVWGLLLILGNVLFFSIYLGVFRPLIERYSVVTFMKWIFLFSLLMGLPFGGAEIMHTDLLSLPGKWLAELAYLIVMATFVAYFLIPLAQQRIRPTLVSMYSYLQPIIAIGISIAIGMDRLTITKVVATLMVFTGVWLVSRSRRAASTNTKNV